MSRRLACGLTALTLLFLGATPASADDTPRIVITRVDATDFPTVRLVASVVDAGGKPISGLRAEDLRLRERNLPASATISLASLTSPVALALVIDTSGSMSGRPIEDAKAGVTSMINALGPEDEVAVIGFSANV